MAIAGRKKSFLELVPAKHAKRVRKWSVANGRDAVVVVSANEYRKLATTRQPRGFFSQTPLVGEARPRPQP
jgi:hypothetical protein